VGSRPSIGPDRWTRLEQCQISSRSLQSQLWKSIDSPPPTLTPMLRDSTTAWLRPRSSRGDCIQAGIALPATPPAARSVPSNGMALLRLPLVLTNGTGTGDPAVTATVGSGTADKCSASLMVVLSGCRPSILKKRKQWRHRSWNYRTAIEPTAEFDVTCSGS